MLPIGVISWLCTPGKFGQWLAIITVSLCAVTSSLGLSWSSGALPKIRNGEAEYSLTLSEQSMAVSSLFLGNIISPVPSAYLMDYLGRRNSLCLVIWLNVFSFVFISFVRGFWPLCVSRFVQGIWIGLVYTAVPVYVGECAHPSIRGILGTFFASFLYTGSLIINCIGSYSSYFMLCIVPAIISAVLAIFLCFVPESPYYYLARGNVEAARSSITWLRGSCNEEDFNALQDSAMKRQKQASYLDLLRSASARKALLIVLLLGAIQRASGLAVLLAYTSVTVPEYIITPGEFMMILNGVWILSCISSTLVMDRFNRRTMMGFSSAGSCLTMFGIAVWFYLRDKTTVEVSSVTWLPFVLLVLHGIAFSFGIVSIPTMLPGEIFSTEMKAKGSGVVSVWTALVNFVVTDVFLPLEVTVGVFINFLICSATSFLGIFSAIFIMIETKGRTLEDIQKVLEGKNTEDIATNKNCNNEA